MFDASSILNLLVYKGDFGLLCKGTIAKVGYASSSFEEVLMISSLLLSNIVLLAELSSF